MKKMKKILAVVLAMAIMATGIVTMKSEVKAVEKVQVTTTYGLYVQ